MGPRFQVVIGVFGLLASATCVASDSWIEFTSSRYILRTDAGELAARRIVTRMEQVDQAFLASGNAHQDAGPVQIYLFAREGEFKEFRSKGWESGLTVIEGTQAPVILLFQSANTEHVMGHEYAHSLIQRWAWKLPMWFEEGLAELCAEAQIRPGKATLGGAIPRHLEYLRANGIEDQMFDSVGGHPAAYYASSWAMVHMLHFDPQYSRGLGAFIQALLDGTPARQAFSSAFSRSQEAALEDLRTYIRNPHWIGRTYDTLASRTSSSSPSSPLSKKRVLTRVESDFRLAGLALDLGRTDTASKRYRKIAGEEARTFYGAEARGLDALSRGDTKVAVGQLRLAAELGSPDARVWTELATLERDLGTPWRQVRSDLEQAAKLDPSDFQANFLLGVRAADDGDQDQAVRLLGKATESAPGRADVWHAYGLALIQLHRLDAAKAAIRRGLKVATTVEQETMLQQLMGDTTATKAPEGRDKPAVSVSPAWSKTAPEVFTEGRFRNFDCAASPPAVVLESGGKLLLFMVVDPKSVEIRTALPGKMSMELRCGKQAGEPVRIGSPSGVNTVLSLEFLQVQGFPWF